MPKRPAPRKIPASVEAFDTLPDSAFVRQPTVEALFSIAPTTVWRWANTGLLPKPHKHGPRVTAWNVGELRAAMQRKAA